MITVYDNTGPTDLLGTSFFSLLRTNFCQYRGQEMCSENSIDNNSITGFMSTWFCIPEKQFLNYPWQNKKRIHSIQQQKN